MLTVYFNNYVINGKVPYMYAYLTYVLCVISLRINRVTYSGHADRCIISKRYLSCMYYIG